MIGKVRIVLAALALTGAAVGPISSAAAHPLGNFTVNRYTRIEVAPNQVRLRYIVDEAEIPTFQDMVYLDGDHNGVVDDAEKQRFLDQRFGLILGNLSLTLNGKSAPLHYSAPELELRPGQGGLQTMRFGAWLDVPADGPGVTGQTELRLDFKDDNVPEGVGWREIVMRPLDGVALGFSTVSTKDQSNELLSYPTDLLLSPLDEREAHASLRASGGSTFVAPARPSGAAVPADDPSASIVATIVGPSATLGEIVANGRLGGPALALAIALTLIWGAAHALTPGHGKTVVAAYLVGSRGTPLHALYLGLTVTATHTAGVYALGLVTLFAARYIVPAVLFPWLSLLSGLAVVAVGVTLVVSRIRQWRRGASPIDHYHDEHGHAHDREHVHEHAHGSHAHDHAPGHTHTHLPPGAEGGRVTWRSIVALGMAGGLLPCPSALVLLLGAIALGQTALGLGLVVVFSFGLAAVLTLVGLTFVWAGRLVDPERLNRFIGARRLFAFAPIGSAALISAIGLVIAFQALGQTGILSNYH